MTDRTALAEDWLSSRMRLCELSAITATQPGCPEASREVIFDTQSCLPPAYCRSSVLSSLEMYTHILRQPGGSQNVGRRAELGQDPPGHSPAAGTKSESVCRFARRLAEDILQSARRQWEMAKARSPHGPPGDPERLNCDIIKPTLKEVAGNGSPWSPRRRSKSAPDWSPGHASRGQRTDCLSRSVEGREAEELPGSCPWFCSGLPPSGQACHSILAHSGLPSRGSLDYPDAPPTTPLLPEMIKSRGSFQRRLKGGLAKEFMPSPPPPTPKDQPSHSPTDGVVAGEDREEFVAHLMRSLSLECSEGGELAMEVDYGDGVGNSRGGPEGNPALSDYAAQLSAEIIGSVTSEPQALLHGRVKEGAPPERLLHAAERWAAEVIEESFLEMMTKEVRERAVDRRSATTRFTAKTEQPNSPPALVSPGPCDRPKDVATVSGLGDGSMSWDGNQMPSNSWADGLNAFAGHLAADALLQALGELRRPTLHCHPDPLQRLAEKLCEAVMAQALHTTIQSSAHQPPRGPAEKCSPDSCNYGIGGDSLCQTQVINPSFAEALAEALVRDSLQEAARHQTHAVKGSDWCFGGPHPEGCGHVTPTRSKVRAVLDKQVHPGIQALQGVLLWAAASNMDTPTLQLELPNTQLQTQFSMVAQRAQLIGWTVGDLMTSLLQYCELAEQMASRGRSLDIPLLKHLQAQGDD